MVNKQTCQQSCLNAFKVVKDVNVFVSNEGSIFLSQSFGDFFRLLLLVLIGVVLLLNRVNLDYRACNNLS